jgi:hypothetical protein
MNVRITAGLAVVTAMLVAGCTSDAPDESSASPAVSPLEGTWRTPAVSPRDVEATLHRHGLEKWVETFQPESPIQRDTVLILHIHDFEWDLYGSSNGGPRREIDYDAAWQVRGHEVEVIHKTGSTTYRWTVEEGVLTLEWLSTTQPPYKGIPDEVFQRALYMTQDFARSAA